MTLNKLAKQIYADYVHGGHNYNYILGDCYDKEDFSISVIDDKTKVAEILVLEIPWGVSFTLQNKLTNKLKNKLKNKDCTIICKNCTVKDCTIIFKNNGTVNITFNFL